MVRTAETLPPFRGRLAGFVYLVYLVSTLLTEVLMERAGAGVRGVSSDAATTAAMLLTHQVAFRLGFALNLIAMAAYIGVAALFYRLFRPVSRTVALLAAFLALVRIGVWASAWLVLLVPLAVLGGSPSLRVFDTGQLDAVALLAVNLSTQAYSIGFFFEGLFWIAIGSLWFRSTFLPRPVGALFALAGVSYLAFLSASLANALLLPIGVFSGIAELSMVLWLVVKGVNARRWEEAARTAGILGPEPSPREPAPAASGRPQALPTEAGG